MLTKTIYYFYFKIDDVSKDNIDIVRLYIPKAGRQHLYVTGRVCSDSTSRCIVPLMKPASLRCDKLSRKRALMVADDAT